MYVLARVRPGSSSMRLRNRKRSSRPPFDPARPRGHRRVASWSGAGPMPASRLAGADALVVFEGVVAVGLVTNAGRVIGLAVLGPGEIWTARADDGGLAGFRVEALCPSEVRLTSVDTLLALASDVEVGRSLVRALLHRAGTAERRFAGLAVLPVEERLLLLLDHLSRLRGVPGPRGTWIDFDLSQDRIAALTGTTRESVNRAVRSLTRRGVVDRRGLRYAVAGGGS